MKLGAVKLQKFLDKQIPPKKPSHFAHEIGTYPSTIHRLLNGQNNPDLATATVIEEKTNGEVSCEDWLTESKKK
jgi:hypothetical protein